MINEQRLIETYLDLIRINSVTGNEREIAEYIARRLEGMGLTVNWSYYEDNKQSPTIYTKLEGCKSGPTILLTGHMDTVEVTKGWNTDPFEPLIIDDKVYGLGACDMKGGISAILETLQTLIDEKVELSGNVIAAFVSDEEVLSRGTYQLLQEGLKADMAIMAECRFSEAAIGFRGRYSINVTLDGEAAHASKYPYVGENAVINASKMAIAVESLPTKNHPELGEGTWCVRHIEGGIKSTLSVPDTCRIFVDRYVVPGETFETCKEQIMGAARELGLEKRTSVELVERKSPYMEAFEVDKNHILVKTIQEKYKKIVGKELSLSYDKSVCDSNFLAVLGNIPTITFGPSGEGFHGPNEYGYISNIKHSYLIYLETVIDLLK